MKVQCFLLLLCFTSALASEDSISKLLDKAKKGLEVATGNSSTLKRLNATLSVATDFAKAVFELVKIIKGETEDSEFDKLKFLKEQFKAVNTKMDALDYDVQEIKDLIKWDAVRISFGEYERRIKATDILLSNYVRAPLRARDVFEDIFTDNFGAHNEDAAWKLYNALVNENTVFGENLFEVARQYFSNDRLKVAKFGAYVCRIIQRGLNHKAAYMLFMGYKDQLKGVLQRWDDRFRALERRAAKVDEAIVSEWPKQFKTDADKMVDRTAAGLSPTQLATNLYNLLKDKFPWRAWIVVVLPYCDNDEAKCKVESCGEETYERLNVGGKSVFINSGDASDLPKRTPMATLNELPKVYSQKTDTSTDLRKASFVFALLPSHYCEAHKLKAVFEESTAPAAIGPAEHFATKKIEVRQVYDQGDAVKSFFMLLAR